MSIQGYYLLPHPPIILPEVGRGEEKKISQTTKGMQRIAEEIAQKAPRTIIIVTPHGAMFRDAISLSYEDAISGNMGRFRAPSVRMEKTINKELTKRIYELASESGIPAVLATDSMLSRYGAEFMLDHGAMVPLYFIDRCYTDYKLVHITYTPINDYDLYRFGIAVSNAARELGEETVFIASGDLSHRLSHDGPYEYSPEGARFDNDFLRLLQDGDVMAFFKMDRALIERRRMRKAVGGDTARRS